MNELALENKPIEVYEWENIPDFGIYSDQLLTIINDSEIINDTDQYMTSSMINNYVKLQVIEKPKKKKYYRYQIAALMMIALMKSIMSIKDIGVFISKSQREIGIDRLYHIFCESIKNKGNSPEDSILEEEKRYRRALDSMVKAINSKRELGIILKDFSNNEV
ncbi:DUF1836 domain-containing protein [Microaceticoccus formicicus]|uniref:DUF1836 domain-containing protein n=1 Tax=Microaceticoccus formicicus TaxID=3118105 RepID=UPI003CD02D45|nr:DUF1836 domain-containing protein [Peptoniphilaceae bacterium AMB_02]